MSLFVIICLKVWWREIKRDRLREREERYRENRVRLGIIILNVKTFIINLWIKTCARTFLAIRLYSRLLYIDRPSDVYTIDNFFLTN